MLLVSFVLPWWSSLACLRLDSVFCFGAGLLLHAQPDEIAHRAVFAVCCSFLDKAFRFSPALLRSIAAAQLKCESGRSSPCTLLLAK